jgi:hypothetical protein
MHIKGLQTKTERLQQRADYVDQYIDSIEFLLIGIGLGILGGIWGDIIKDFLFNFFGNKYIYILTVVSLVGLYFMSFPIRRARRMAKATAEVEKDCKINRG